MCDYEKRFECDIYELTASCLCIIHFFLLHEISARAEKNLLLTCKKWQQHDAICYACLLFCARAQKICILTLILTFVPLTLIFVPHACFFVHGAHLSRTDEETLAKKGFLLAFLCLCAKKFAFSSGTFVPFTPCYVRVRNGIMFTLCYVRVSV